MKYLSFLPAILLFVTMIINFTQGSWGYGIFFIIVTATVGYFNWIAYSHQHRRKRIPCQWRGTGCTHTATVMGENKWLCKNCRDKYGL